MPRIIYQRTGLLPTKADLPKKSGGCPEKDNIGLKKLDSLDR